MNTSLRRDLRKLKAYFAESKKNFLTSHILRKQSTLPDATTVVSPRNELKNSIPKTCHRPDLGSASDWLKQILLVA